MDGDPVLAAYLAGRDEPCPQCGYNLRGGISSACPECGAEIKLTIARSTASSLPWIFTLIGVSVPLATGIGIAALGIIASIFAGMEPEIGGLMCWNATTVVPPLVTLVTVSGKHETFRAKAIKTQRMYGLLSVVSGMVYVCFAWGLLVLLMF